MTHTNCAHNHSTDTLENPFLKPSSYFWTQYTFLFAGILGALFLIVSFILSYFYSNLSYVFLVFVYFLTGTQALIESLRTIARFRLNIQVLMTLAALLSVVIGSAIEGGLLLVLFALSEAMEEFVTKKTRSAITQLEELCPTKAVQILDDDTHISVSLKSIALGDLLLIKPGEVISLDATVVDGASFINMQHLTGEAEPVAVEVGSQVTAGSINIDGALIIKVTKTSSESTLAKIIELIVEAQKNKPKIARFLDSFSNIYATSIICIAFLVAITLPLITSLPYLGLEGSVYRALAFLIAASPCALIIATPTAYLSSISTCLKSGLLLKGGIVLDALAKTNAICFDKTGTLTTGKLSLSSIDTISDGVEQDRILSIAYGLERKVKHPVANAINCYCQNNNIQPQEVQNLKNIAGHGIEAQVTLNNKTTPVIMGSLSFIKGKITSNLKLSEKIKSLKKQDTKLITLLLIENSITIFHFEDQLRPEIPALLGRIKKHFKMKQFLLTGDRLSVAEHTSQDLPLNEIFADLKPEDKLKKVEELSKKYTLIMIGDGINDAPALAQAAVGIAMGGIGSASAKEAGDIILAKDDLSLIAPLIKRAKKTISIIKQNLTLALLVILFATITSLTGLIHLWLAVVLHEGSTIVVGLNSLRLLRKLK